MKKFLFLLSVVKTIIYNDVLWLESSKSQMSSFYQQKNTFFVHFFSPDSVTERENERGERERGKYFNTKHWKKRYVILWIEVSKTSEEL